MGNTRSNLRHSVNRFGKWTSKAPRAQPATMAVAAAQPQDEAEAERVKAMAAATDNVGLFFGEDIFIAIGSILLMKGFMAQNGIELTPFELSVWAIPTAIAAFLIHGFRLWLLDRRLNAQATSVTAKDEAA